MRSLLEFRDKIKYYYRKYEFVILPTLKFMLAYLAICCVNGSMGYMAQVDQVGIVLIASLVCSFMPLGCIVFMTAVFSLLHMYTLSMEVALVGICVYLIMMLIFMRFDSRHSILLVITAICAAMKIPYVVPITVGLLASPSAAISVGCGLVAYSFLNVITTNATIINGMGSGEELAKVRLLIDGVIKNREMLVMVAAFTITICVVYLIRRLSVDYSWSIAMVSGGIINVLVILVGDLMYDTNVSVVAAIFTTILALVIAKVFEFMQFAVDYSRTENVQFEDDEYYYYVKAIPKMTVAAQSKTVKKINSQKAAPEVRTSTRSVVTEHTGMTRRATSLEDTNPRSVAKTNARSVTISSYLDEEDFEDLD